jgi:cytochrome P450
MGRQAVRRTEVAGHPIAKGIIMNSHVGVHRYARWFEGARAFRPER